MAKPLDPTKVKEVRKKTPDALIIERTPHTPTTTVETHNIEAVRAKIAKYQAILDEYESMH